MRRVLELVRVSTVGQASDEHASIESQRTLNRRTADQYGLTIVRSIEMAGVSGTSVLLAPEMQEMIRLMGDPEIHGVVAREFSRLMRPENYADYALLQVFVDNNCMLYLPDGPIDFASNDGRLVGTLKASIAGNVRREMLKAAWESREEKRRRGELAQSRVCLPFGVDNKKDKWWYTADSERVREAFRLVLAGETSYFSIGKQVDIEPQSLRYMLRNPIYTGWRIVDKKRDMTSAGKYPTKDGRQGDRRKIKRAPDEVIKVQVMEPLVSESDFALVQQILGMKQSRHWRTTPGFEHRYTYMGYLKCTCQGKVYTKLRGRDYYICKDRCGAHHMQRAILDPALDKFFAKKLPNSAFLKRIAKTRRPEPANTDALAKQIESLGAKRERILEAYFEGVISSAERDKKIADVEREKQVFSDLLSRDKPAQKIDAQALAKQFKVFAQFDLLNREQKRRILNTITPEIVVANYHIEGLFCGIGDTLTDRGNPGNARIYLALDVEAA